jgi:hypothetical protein
MTACIEAGLVTVMVKSEVLKLEQVSSKVTISTATE